MSFGKVLNNRLEYLIKKRGINTSQLHKHTGIPLTTLKRLRLNKENNPTIASLIPIANYFSVTLDQLVGTTALSENNTKPNRIVIPLIDWENALNSKKNRRKLASSFILITDSHLSGDSYALEVKTNHLINFSEGSLLIIDPNVKPHDRDFIITYKKEECLPLLKQWLIYENNYYLKNVNSEPEIVPLSEKYKSLGVVAQIIMNYKKSSLHVPLKDEKIYSAKKY